MESMANPRLIRLLALLSAATLSAALLAGCGARPDKDTSDTSATAPSITTGPTEPATPTTPQTTAPTKTSQASNAASGLLINNPYGLPVDKTLTAQLEELLLRLQSKASIYYKDLETGLTIEYLADKQYQAASVIKAPYMHYLLEFEEIDPAEKLTLKIKQGGSKHIDDFAVGTQFTVEELIQYTILYSDNSAYYLLAERYGFKGFNQYAAGLGIQTIQELPLQFPKPRFGYLTARDAGIYFEDIYHFIESDTPNAQKLYTYLTSTTYQKQITAALGDQYPIAHKYGEQGDQGYHDAAIVYAPQPYILTIFTTLTPETSATLDYFHEIAHLINNIHLSARTSSGGNSDT